MRWTATGEKCSGNVILAARQVISCSTASCNTEVVFYTWRSTAGRLEWLTTVKEEDRNIPPWISALSSIHPIIDGVGWGLYSSPRFGFSKQRSHLVYFQLVGRCVGGFTWNPRTTSWHRRVNYVILDETWLRHQSDPSVDGVTTDVSINVSNSVILYQSLKDSRENRSDVGTSAVVIIGDFPDVNHIIKKHSIKLYEVLFFFFAGAKTTILN